MSAIAEEVKAPALVVYEDGSVIARTFSRSGGFAYRRGFLSEPALNLLSDTSIRYFSSAYQDHFQQQEATDLTTTVVEMHHNGAIAGTSIYGAGIYSIAELKSGLHFSSHTIGLPDELLRLLAELYYAAKIATEPWHNIPRGNEGIPFFAHSLNSRLGAQTDPAIQKVPNKSPEPTPTAVTPRATESKSK